MTAILGIRCFVRALGLAWMALSGASALAMSILPPEPVAILFESRTDRLTRDGQIAVDRLAVRGAQCPGGELAVHVLPAANAEAALTRKQAAAVQDRLKRLGLNVVAALEPLRWRETHPPARRNVLLADVATDDDVWCHLREESHIFVWAAEMAQFVEGHAPSAPAFWQRLSSSARLDSLALPLATAALCPGTEKCESHPELFHWLAERALRRASSEDRRWWLLQLWTFAVDEHVNRFSKRFGLAPLTVAERAGQAHELSESRLPWTVIEQRLLEPEVMQRFGEKQMIAGGPGPHWLLDAAIRRGQLDSYDRLLDAAGPAKTCIVEGAFHEAFSQEERLEVLRPHFANWVRGLGTPFRPQGRFYDCNPAALIAAMAFCGDEQNDAANEGLLLWNALLQAGVTLDSPAIRASLATKGARGPKESALCRLERVPGSTTRLRPVAPE